MNERMNIKSIVILLLTAVITLVFLGQQPASAKTAATQAIRVYVQDKEIYPGKAPVIQGGRLYIEFRSAVQALGFKFKYDAAKKVVTAESEDATFKIDLKAKKAYVNGYLFTYSATNPVFIGSGADIMVIAPLFNRTDYINADYNQAKKTVNVYVNLQGKPRKSDLKIIRAQIEAHYQASGGLASITSLETESWGTYTTMLAEISIPKGGNELLDRIEHATIEMEHTADKIWTIHHIDTDTDYLDYTLLARQEVQIPGADQAAIYALLEADIQAKNEENVDALLALQNPGGSMFAFYPDIDELRQYLEFTFTRLPTVYSKEQAVIAAYQPDKAAVYYVYTIEDKKDASEYIFRMYTLASVVKAEDGKWYMNPDDDIVLDSELVSKF